MRQLRRLSVIESIGLALLWAPLDAEAQDDSGTLEVLVEDTSGPRSPDGTPALTFQARTAPTFQETNLGPGRSFTDDGERLGTGSGRVITPTVTGRLGAGSPPRVVTVPDAALRAVLEDKLGLSAGDPIPATALGELTTLEARDAGIIDLTGLEYATGLTFLDLGPGPTRRDPWANSNDVSDLPAAVGSDRSHLAGPCEQLGGGRDPAIGPDTPGRAEGGGQQDPGHEDPCADSPPIPYPVNPKHPPLCQDQSPR